MGSRKQEGNALKTVMTPTSAARETPSLKKQLTGLAKVDKL